MKIKLLFVVFFLNVLAFASDIIETIDPIWKVIGPLILGLGERFPLILAIVVIMGGARIIFKPLMSAIRAYVEWTPTKSDDIILNKIESSIPFKIFAYLLDWAFSVKIEKK